MVLLAFPVLAAALLVLEIDRKLGAQVFAAASGGAILWQHLFWFFGHPEVYIVAIPFFGIATEILPVFSRKPLFGYKGMVGATLGIAGLSMTVWAHHMFTTGAVLLPFFSLMSLLHRDPDRDQVLQLDRHHVARPADLRGADAVHHRVHGHLPVRRADRRHPGLAAAGLRASATPTSWSPTSTTCCSAPWCSPCSAGSTSGGPSGPARNSTRPSGSGTSGRCSSASG